MTRSPFGSVRARVILVQVVIFAGLIAYFKILLPTIEKARAAAEVAKREEKITSFVQSVVVEAGVQEAEASAKDGEASARARRLRITPSVSEVQQALGAPDQTMTDFRGGQHLTWIGTRHKLEVSFDKGRLYALMLSDLATGHGMTVYESSVQYRQF